MRRQVENPDPSRPTGELPIRQFTALLFKASMFAMHYDEKDRGNLLPCLAPCMLALKGKHGTRHPALSQSISDSTRRMMSIVPGSR